jgi:hypothetical protein
MGESRGTYRVSVGKLREGENLKDQGIDGKIILKWILWTWDGERHGLDRSGSG